MYPNFDDLAWELNGTPIKWGAFLTTLVSFLLTALVLFALVSLARRAGIGNFRASFWNSKGPGRCGVRPSCRIRRGVTPGGAC